MSEAENQGEIAKDADNRALASGRGDKDFVLFDDKIEIHYGKPMPRYDVGANKVYQAFSKDKDRTPLIAIICERQFVPRVLATNVYVHVSNPNIAQLVAHGKVYWPPAKQERYVFIYVDNLGKPLLEVGAKAALGVRQEDVMRGIIRPMINVFQDFRSRDFVHGAIRPMNMFDGNSVSSEKFKNIILGDCLSTPSSYMQPALYEPIERAMADPIARGEGTQAEDLYAFGATLAVILRTHDPMHDMGESEIIKHKIIHGSYAALTGRDRFKGEILELLRGLLHDDPAERWTFDDLLVWLDGRRLSPKQSVAIKKAQRPFAFGGEQFLLMPLLAMSLRNNPSEVRRIVEDESLLQWLDRSVDDEPTVMRYEKAISSARQLGVGTGYEDRLVSNVAIALDPSAPLFYKGLRLLGEGIGSAIAEAIVLKQPLAPYAEIFNSSLALNWLAVQRPSGIDAVGLHNKFELCRRILRSNKIGEGFERICYILCPEAPCLSETLKEYCITTPEDLLLAFEDLCQKKKEPNMFLDRHVVGFLLQRDPKIIEPIIFDLNASEPHRVVLANLKCLAAIGRRYNVRDVPGVVRVMGAKIPIVFQRYHDRSVREKLKKSVEECIAAGDLQKMAALLDNADVIRKDMMTFKAAMGEYSVIEKERQALDFALENAMEYGFETGREWSAIVSTVIAGIVILFVCVMYMSKKTVF